MRLHIVEHRAAVERRRDRVLVCHDGVKVRFGRVRFLDRAHEFLEPLHAVDLVGVADFRRIETAAQHGNRFVVGLERHREGVAVLAAVGKGEARRIGEAASACRESTSAISASDCSVRGPRFSTSNSDAKSCSFLS